jgi:hypothetical protein
MILCTTCTICETVIDTNDWEPVKTTAQAAICYQCIARGDVAALDSDLTDIWQDIAQDIAIALD